LKHLFCESSAKFRKLKTNLTLPSDLNNYIETSHIIITSVLTSHIHKKFILITIKISPSLTSQNNTRVMHL